MAFYNEINNHHNIVISFTASPKYDFGSFATGYYQAAKKLAEDFLSESGHRDYEGYPIVFLYRHALELNLKNIIYHAIRLCSFKEIEVIYNKLYNTHDLTLLFELSIELLHKLLPEDFGIKKVCENIQKTSSEFNEIDPTSYSYRYPINQKGQYSTKHHQVVNISSIYVNMNKLLDDLEIINFGLDVETYQAEEVYELLEKFSSV